VGTSNEKRFEYSKNVSELKQFIKGKKWQLQEDITCRTISDNRVKTAKRYIGIIECVLGSEYLRGSKLSLKVFELMEILKTDDISLKKKIEEAQRQLKRMSYFMNASVEELMAVKEYGIPDEFGIHQNSIISMKRELLAQIETIEEELKRYRYRLKQCRDLKGMISRPNGFYRAVYK